MHAATASSLSHHRFNERNIPITVVGSNSGMQYLSESLRSSFNGGMSFGSNRLMAPSSYLQLISPPAAARLGSFDGMLEDRFCKDFVCCGMKLDSLHELLQHLEDCHADEESSSVSGEGAAAAVENSVFHFEEQPLETMPFYFEAPTAIIFEGPSGELMELDSPTTSSSPSLQSVYHPSQFQQQPQNQIPSASQASTADQPSKPFKCTVAGCSKSYKNPGGLKYHLEHGHPPSLSAQASSEIRPYQCHICDRKYKNASGLKYHILHTHN